VGAPETVYRRPETAFAARFLGLNNIIPVERQTGGIAHTALGDFRLEHPVGAVLLHPDGIRFDPNGTISGVVKERTFQGDAFRLLVQAAENVYLTVKLPGSADRIPAVGDTVSMNIEPAWVIPLA
jgi:ABC-type Fe3+/spermidine/putrescine transport system ATPase subunit